MSFAATHQFSRYLEQELNLQGAFLKAKTALVGEAVLQGIALVICGWNRFQF